MYSYNVPNVKPLLINNIDFYFNLVVFVHKIKKNMLAGFIQIHVYKNVIWHFLSDATYLYYNM